MKVKPNSWPMNNEIAFTIRDDDISYFTEPWMLEALYGEAWSLGFKVSLAVIPKVIATYRRHVPLPHRGSKRSFCISENRELMDYLLEKISMGCVDVVQHGYTHAGQNRKPEFTINDRQLLDKRLRKGNESLRATFKRDITVFVAPHDKISRAAWKSLCENKMCFSRRFTTARFLLTAFPGGIKYLKLVKAMVRSPNPFKPMPDSIIDLTNMLVIQWDLFLLSQYLETQLEEAKEHFLDRYRKKDAFILAHHYWDYFDWERKAIRKNLLDPFNKFLRFVSSSERVWKTTLSEICSWIQFGRY